MNVKITIAIAAACLAGVAGTAVAAPPATNSITQQVLDLNVPTSNLSVKLLTSSAYGGQKTGSGNGVEDMLAKDFSNTASEVGSGVTSQIENCLNPSQLADKLVDSVVNRYTGGGGFGGNMTSQSYETSVGLGNFDPKSPQWGGDTKPVTLPSPPGSPINVNTDLPTQQVQVPSAPGAPGNINTDLPLQRVQIPRHTPVQPKKPLVGSSVYSGSGE